MGKMDCPLILSVKVSVEKIKGAAHENLVVNGTCKPSLSCDINTSQMSVLTGRQTGRIYKLLNVFIATFIGAILIDRHGCYTEVYVYNRIGL